MSKGFRLRRLGGNAGDSVNFALIDDKPVALVTHKFIHGLASDYRFRFIGVPFDAFPGVRGRRPYGLTYRATSYAELERKIAPPVGDSEACLHTCGATA